MGDKWWHGAIVLVVFGQVSLSIGELYILELVGVSEDHCWSGGGFDISF